MNGDPQVLLASASPRRRELLQQIGVRFDVVAPELDEAAFSAPQPSQLALLLAREKARAGRMLAAPRGGPALPVLGADTIVSINGDPLGKPRDRQHAKDMLQRLSGRTHQVISAVCVATQAEELCDCVSSDVTFKNMTDTDIERYCATAEPYDKAGAYAVQGLGAAFVKRLEGSYTGVVGLPMYETRRLLKKINVDWL